MERMTKALRAALVAAWALGLVAMGQGCALFTEYIEVKVPVREPCLDQLPAVPRMPLAAIDRTATAKALQPGNEWQLLDPAMETLQLQDAYIRALRKAVAPCVAEPPGDPPR